jgi:hypothetical protein
MMAGTDYAQEVQMKASPNLRGCACIRVFEVERGMDLSWGVQDTKRSGNARGAVKGRYNDIDKL